MKKICFVLDSLNVGGAEKLTLEVVNAIHSLGKYKVSLIYLAESDKISFSELIPSEVKVYFFDISRYGFISKILKLSQLLSKFDVVHSSLETSNLICSLSRLFILKKIKFISTIHGMDGVFFKEPNVRKKINEFGLKYKILIKYVQNFTFKFYHRFIAVCFDTKKFLIEQRHISEDKVKVIYHGLNISSLEEKYNNVETEDIRLKYDISEKDFLIGYIGRIAYAKGLEYLLEALKEIVKFYPNIKLMIVGDGILKDYLKQYSKENGLSKNCIFLSTQKNLKSYYKSFDLFLLPSFSESTNLTVLEALYFKTLVLTSNAGGLSEIIEDGKNGFLFNTGDFEDMKQKIGFIINNVQKFSELKKQGFQTVMNKFNLNENVKMIAQFFEEII